MSEHSIYSPSASARWLQCPGSIRLSAKCPPQKTHASAEEGTHAHSLAEMCFKNSCKAHHFIGELTPSGYLVNKTMAKHVQTYVDYVHQTKAQAGGELLIEQRLTLPNEPKVYGTGDAILLGDKSLHIFDFKYGKWVVNTKENTQLMIYALGALDIYCRTKPEPEFISMHICQPRAKHKDGPNRMWYCSTSHLRLFALQVSAAVTESLKPEPQLNDGEHCRFCPAELICPKLNGLGRAIQV